MIHLKEIEESDIELIRRWPAYQGDMDQLDYALRQGGWIDELGSRKGAAIYGALEGDELIGFSILAPTGELEAEFRIALRADRTGQGLGEEISYLTLRRGFEGMGLSRIHLIVRKNNGRGRALYRRLRFADTGECQKDIRGKSVDFLMMDINAEAFARYRKETGASRKPRRALVVIDVQNDYSEGKLPIAFPPVEGSLANIGAAMDNAKKAGIPIVAIQNLAPEGAAFLATGSHGAELHETVASRGWDHYIRKNLPSAFVGTDLEKWLRADDIDTITVIGYMTHNCVLSTVIYAMHLGFAVELLSDAAGSVAYANRTGRAGAEEIHRVATVVMQSRFAAVMTTAEWKEILASGQPPERDTIIGSYKRALEPA